MPSPVVNGRCYEWDVGERRAPLGVNLRDDAKMLNTKQDGSLSTQHAWSPIHGASCARVLFKYYTLATRQDTVSQGVQVARVESTT